ncbi:MAG: metalloregulator ArsR/SmtB family transcription factor [Desulfosarcinaceae bacterium]|nr:metalloregulator ArsR/SmtB family transcription factor [Desulfosarcinaceae bacterium]
MAAQATRSLPLETNAVRILHTDRIDRARSGELPKSELHHLADTFKLMGDPNRLKLLMALKDGEMCVCDLAAFIGITESAVSHQLRRLKDARLVRPRREGQILFYQLDDACVVELMTIAVGHLRGAAQPHEPPA